MKTSFSLEGLTCAHCAAKIEQSILKAPNVLRAELNFVTRTLSVETQDGALPEGIQRIIQTIEPGVRVVERAEVSKASLLDQLESVHRELRKRFARISSGGTIFLLSFFPPFSGQSSFWLLLIAYGIIGYPVLIDTWKKAVKKNLFNESFLMTIATISALLIGEPAEAVGVMAFYEIGELLSAYAVNRSRYRIFGLLDRKREIVSVIREGAVSLEDPREVNPGEIFIVKPGERILLDGKIETGEALIDTASLTGESVPREYKKGDEVLSGFINTNATLRIRAAKRYEDSAVARMLSLIEEAALKKSKMEQWIARFASVYTPIVVFSAMVIAILPPLLWGLSFETWLYRALVLLVISCPCALVLSIPLASFIAVGKLSKRGILVKGSHHTPPADLLRAILNAKAVIFDKTGTLTTGILKIDRVSSFAPYSKETVLRFAAIGEYHSLHPMAGALRDFLPEDFSVDDVTEHRETAGFGLAFRYKGSEILLGSRKFLASRQIQISSSIDGGEMLTTLFVAVEGFLAGVISFSDSDRFDSARLITYLRERGLKTFMLSGDRESSAKEVSDRLGVDQYFSELSPEMKIEKYETIRDQDGISLFIGDGINDAPVLRRADVGIAMGSKSSGITLESADIVIAGEEISKVATLFDSADRHAKIIWQNIFLILGIKALFLLLGGFGLSSLWEAVFADVGVTLLCVLNAFRLS